MLTTVMLRFVLAAIQLKCRELTYKSPPRNMSMTPNLRRRLMARFLSCFIGKTMTIKSRTMLTAADAQASAFRSMHLPWCSPSQCSHAMRMGMHCSAVARTNVMMYKTQSTIVAYMARRRVC
jgi:hypothetical protein